MTDEDSGELPSLQQFYMDSLRAGVSPESFWTMTLAEVSSVSNGLFFRDKMTWNHTSSQMALLANVNSSKNKKFEPKDFNPYTEKKKVPTRNDVRELKESFTKISWQKQQ